MQPSIIRVVLLLLLTLKVCPVRCQVQDTFTKACSNAEILDLQGKWRVVKPVERPLHKWDCVEPGEEITLAKAVQNGQITVIYHQGSRHPYTMKCPTRADCNNAYKIEKAVPDTPKSKADRLLDFFFSVFPKNDPKPVPGILQGSLSSGAEIVCSEGREVHLTQDLGRAAQNYKLTFQPLSSNGEKASFGPVEVRDQPHGLGERSSIQDASSSIANATTAASSHETAAWVGHRTTRVTIVFPHEIEQPILYEVQLKPAHKQGRKEPFVVLIASPPYCSALTSSYQEAVDYTNTWQETPIESIWSFRLLYLVGLASQSHQVPD